MTESLAIINNESESEPIARCACCEYPLHDDADIFTHDRLANEPHCEACYNQSEVTNEFQCSNCSNCTEVSHHPDSEPAFPYYDGYECINGEILCQDCHTYCERCDCNIHIDNYGGDGLCQYCYDEQLANECSEDDVDSCADLDPYTIYSYSTKPSNLTFWESDYERKSLGYSNVYLGIELEVCFDLGQWNSIACAVTSLNLNSKYIWKYDGSLSSDDYTSGAELVTEPCTLQFHRWLKWREILKALANNGARSHDAKVCGLHVHINRSAFKDIKNDRAYELKLQKFFERNKIPLVRFSKRRDLGYCQIDDVDRKKFKNATYLKDKKTGNRYVAVNFENYNTVEIRLFSGTLYFPRFIASLQFCDAIVHFVNSHSLLACSNENSWGYFCEFCKRHAQYNLMIEYFKEKNLCA